MKLPQLDPATEYLAKTLKLKGEQFKEFKVACDESEVEWQTVAMEAQEKLIDSFVGLMKGLVEGFPAVIDAEFTEVPEAPKEPNGGNLTGTAATESATPEDDF